MLQKPLRVFLLLMILAVVAIAVDLPNNYRLQTKIFNIPVDTTLNPVSVDLTLFGVSVKKNFRTSLGLDLAGGTQVTLEADMKGIAEGDRLTALESAKEIIERRVNFFGVSEPVVQSAHAGNSYRIIVELPGVTDTETAVSTIGQTARLEFREFTQSQDATAGAYFLPTLENTKPSGITGKDLKRAQVTFNSQTGAPEVGVEFTADGSKKFADTTTRLVGKKLPIFLDEQPLMWPTVNVPITNGQAVITGGFTLDQAKIIALQLNAGALPVPVKVVEKRTVEASLGQSSVDASIKAGVIGLTIVGFYMITLYGSLGVIAVMALILYGLISYAIFRWVPITLTLPGIAGFFLSIGMAVDANILIFERFKEELRKGKPWKIAMELGFGKAWDSIRDANITTIVTSLILYNPANVSWLPTSGLVRGFAATLLIGVLVSLFTGIVVTRTYIRVFFARKYGKAV